MTNRTRDKNGREIMVSDVLKVFHFFGARGKRHYMYQHVMGTLSLGVKNPAKYFRVSRMAKSEGDVYDLSADKGVLKNCEIVQGWDFFEDRPKESEL